MAGVPGKLGVLMRADEDGFDLLTEQRMQPYYDEILAKTNGSFLK